MPMGTSDQAAVQVSAESPKKVVLVIHAEAPQASALNWRELCAKALGPEADVQERRVHTFDAVRQAAAEAASSGASLVVAVGGDGTVNNVVNGVGTHPSRIAILPAGTTNDIGFQLGQGFDGAAIAASLGSFVPVDVDGMKVDGRRFVAGATLGWMAESISIYNNLRARAAWRRILRPLGHIVYPLIAIGVILFSKRFFNRLRVRYVDLDDGQMKSREVDSFGCFVAGPPHIGRGSFGLTPDSDMADGKIEILFFPRSSRLGLFKLMGAMQNNKLHQIPGVFSIQTRRVEIEAERPSTLIIDGEALAPASSFVIEVEPHALHFIAPKGPRPGSRLLSQNSGS